MTPQLLRPEQREKADPGDDALFYADPRFVQHLDAAFRRRLSELYRQRIPAGAVVLDLMSSWVSHLPEEVSYGEVIGHGLNDAELAANPRLDRHWRQNLNVDQKLPLADASVDAALIVAFSNRMFASKAPRVWLEGSDREHLSYVAEVLTTHGWQLDAVVAEDTRAAGPQGWLGGRGDPFFAVIVQR